MRAPTRRLQFLVEGARAPTRRLHLVVEGRALRQEDGVFSSENACSDKKITASRRWPFLRDPWSAGSSSKVCALTSRESCERLNPNTCDSGPIAITMRQSDDSSSSMSTAVQEHRLTKSRNACPT